MPSLRSLLAILPAVVVLPEPWRPTIIDAGRPPALAVAERGVDRAHERLELVVADLDEVVLRRDPHDALLRLDLGLDDLADRLLADARDEALHHLERDVRLEQRDADVAQRVVDHLGGDLACGPSACSGPP